MIRFFIIFLSTLLFAFPNLTSRVVDEAQILSKNTKEILEKELEIYENNSSNQIAVVSVKSLNGREILEYGVEMARSYKLGQKGKNNGVLLLVAPNEREVAIEVGYGLEEVLTDGLSSQIINEVIIPKFKNGDMNGGVLDGVRAIMLACEGKFEASKNLDIEPSQYGFWLVFASVLGVILSVNFGSFVSRIARASLGGSFVSLFSTFFIENIYVFGGIFIVVAILIFLFGNKFKGFGSNNDDIFTGGGFGGNGGFRGGLGGFGKGGFRGGGGSFGGGGAKGKW